MSNRAFRLATALAGAALAVTGTTGAARAQQSAPAPAARPLIPASHAAAPARNTPPPPPRPAAPAATDPYTCHPGEDVVCTVVRETAQGLIIATYRGSGDEASAWTVVSGTPPGVVAAPGGTVYVVPNLARTAVAPPPMPPNGAPIID